LLTAEAACANLDGPPPVDSPAALTADAGEAKAAKEKATANGEKQMREMSGPLSRRACTCPTTRHRSLRSSPQAKAYEVRKSGPLISKFHALLAASPLSHRACPRGAGCRGRLGRRCRRTGRRRGRGARRLLTRWRLTRCWSSQNQKGESG
jgi:hypothetical protein